MFRIILLYFFVFPVCAKEIIVANYHNYSPWIIDEENKKGIFFEFVQELNKRSKGEYTFIAQIYPRARLDLKLIHNPDIIVPFVDPKFFNDLGLKKYSWSKNIFEDKSYFVFNKGKEFDTQDLSTLKNKRFSATIGHQYPDLEPYFNNRHIKKDETSTYISSILKIVHNRNVDFAVMDDSFKIYVKTKKIIPFEKISFSQRPRFIIKRMILVNNSDPKLLMFLNNCIVEIQKEPRWQKKFPKL